MTDIAPRSANLASLSRNLTLLPLRNFFKNFALWLPIITLYFLDKGLSLEQVLWLLSIQSFSQLLLEIPSGMCADTFGRKTCLVVSDIAKVFFIVTIWQGDQFWQFAIAFAFYGAVFAFDSGAESAFLFDTIKALGREGEYMRHEGRVFGAMLSGFCVAGVIGGYVADFSYEAAVALSLPPFALAVGISLFLIEPPASKSSDERWILHRAMSALRASPAAMRGTIQGALVIGTLLIAQRIYQVYLEQLGFSMVAFGYIYAVLLGTSALAARTAGVVFGGIRPGHRLPLLGALVAVHFILSGVFASTVGLLAILLGQVAWGAVRPCSAQLINSEVGSSERATILSFQGFLASIIVIFGSPVAGYLAAQSLLSCAIVGACFILAGLAFTYRTPAPG